MRNSDFFTVGELAKEMDVTVRTLQYYDKEGLLKPSTKSGGGRRLYSKKDMVKLHQILSLKYLSFSLAEEWRNMINDFTGGDMSLLPNLIEFNNKEN